MLFSPSGCGRCRHDAGVALMPPALRSNFLRIRHRSGLPCYRMMSVSAMDFASAAVRIDFDGGGYDLREVSSVHIQPHATALDSRNVQQVFDELRLGTCSAIDGLDSLANPARV